MADGVKLAWVMHDCRVVHVSGFKSIRSPKDRPAVHCPGCNERVTLKLGDTNAHHAAHEPSSKCGLTRPETALHYNTKMWLAEVLRGLTSVSVTENCMGWADHVRPCRGTRPKVWIEGWTDIREERAVFTRRPDIVLYRGTEVLGAVEVWVSHKVEPAKQDEYAAWRIPWIEIRGTWNLIQGNTAWNGTEPLRPDRRGPSAPPSTWMCEHCVQAAQRAADLAREEQLRAERRDRAHQWWLANRESLERAEQDNRRRVAAEAHGREVRRQARAREESELARVAFANSAFGMTARLRSNGVLVARLRAFDRVAIAERPTRDALLMADEFRDGSRIGAFVGLLSNGRVLFRVTADSTGAVDHLQLKTAADQWIDDISNAAAVADPGNGWFRLMSLLSEDRFTEGWFREGSASLSSAPTSPEWRPAWASHARPDSLDLARFYMDRHLVEWPLRWRWDDTGGGALLPTSSVPEPRSYWPTRAERNMGAPGV